MVNSEEARPKLTNAKLNKLKSAAKNKTGITFQDEELPHKLFLITRQKAKVRNAFAKNMSIDIKFSKAHFSEIIQ